MTIAQEWVPCITPQIGDTLKWNEPLWAAPNKPRGKRDKIGEQEIVAILTKAEELLEFKVISVKNISSNKTTSLSVQEHDEIKRKQSSIAKGDCHQLVS